MTPRALAATCLCLFASLAQAQEAPAQPEAVVREILALSGERELIAFFVAGSEAELDKARKEVNPKDFKLLRTLMREVFQPEALYQATFAGHRDAYDAKRSTALLEWLRTPLARRVMEQELRVASFGQVKPMQQYLKQLQAQPLPAARQALLEDLQQSSRVMEYYRRTIALMLRNAMTAINATAPAHRRVSPEQLEQLLLREQDKIAPALRQSVRDTVRFTYRDLSDDEVRAYTRFLESDLGRWFARVRTDARLNAMERAGATLRESLARAIEQKKRRK
jgi:hypothetical protein